MKIRSLRYLATFSVLFFCIIVTCLTLILSGAVNLSIHSFAVDTNHRLYVGTENKILVYQNGELVNTINPHTSKGYMFTICEDETIMLAAPSKVYIMDLKGDIVREYEDFNMYNKLKTKRNSFTASNGDEYRKVGALGRTRIIKNNQDTVYRISLLSVIVKFFIIFSAISILVFPVCLIRIERNS